MTAQPARNSDWAAIPRHLIEQFWPQVEYRIRDALSYSPGHQSAEDIRQGLVDGSLLLLACESVCVVIELIEYPRKKALHAVIIAGDGVDAWMPELIEHMEHLAREQGATEISGNGREGWGRYMRKYGFTTYAFVTREVKP